MSTTTVRLDTTNVEAGLRRLQTRVPGAAARAINRSLTSARVVMVRAVASDLALRQADVTPSIHVQQATAARLYGTVEGSGKRIPLAKFKARDRFPRGVTARLPGGAGSYPRAFIRTMRSGHVGVYVRRSAPRLPIVELKGPSVTKVFAKHLPAGVARAEEQLVKNMAHEMGRLRL